MDTQLLNRVKLGNAKLNGAWLKAQEVVNDAAEWSRLMGMIDRAWPRLEILCMELISEGYCDCLYRDGERTKCFEDDGRFCWVCPKKPCYACGGSSWWWRQNNWAQNGDWLCSRCYPPGDRKNEDKEKMKGGVRECITKI